MRSNGVGVDVTHPGQVTLSLLDGDPAGESALQLAAQGLAAADGVFLKDPDGRDVGLRLDDAGFGGIGGIELAHLGSW